MATAFGHNRFGVGRGVPRHPRASAATMTSANATR